MSTIEEIAARHGFSADAGRAAYAALQAGGVQTYFMQYTRMTAPTLVAGG